MPGNKIFALNFEVTAKGDKKGEVMIYSSISSWSWWEDDPTVTSNKFDKALKALGDVDELTVRINSPGGVVSEAIAIRTTLMKHPASKTIDIEGDCCSAATLIACLPGAKVRMAKGGQYMIHCCSAGAWGQADRLLSVYNSMLRTDQDMADIYATRTGMTAEEAMEAMKAETWYNAEEAVEAGFVDEIIDAEPEDVPMVACAVDEETMALMRSCYAHAPERPVRERTGEETTSSDLAALGHLPLKGKASGEDNEVSNEQSAVAEHSTEIKNEGVTHMDLKNATAEQLGTENPELAAQIAQQAVAAERQRMQEIDDMTPPGEQWQALAAKAKADGTSALDYHKQVVAKQKADRQAFLEARSQETKATDQVGSGDAGDHDGDDREARLDREAKLLADLADSIDDSTIAMA